MNLDFNGTGHLTTEDINLLKNNLLSGNNKLPALEHISNCEECSLLLSQSYRENELLQTPAGFVEGTMNLIQISAPKNLSTRKNEFWAYTFRVAFAMCVSLAIVFSGSFNYLQKIDSVEIKSPNLSFADTAVNSINNFSNKIISWRF